VIIRSTVKIEVVAAQARLLELGDGLYRTSETLPDEDKRRWVLYEAIARVCDAVEELEKV
jgi:hypothetical protein